MTKRSKTMLATGGVVLALAAGAGGALAGGPGGPGGHGPGPASAAVATYLGLTQDELRTQLRSGKTLAQIATAQGKSVTGLEDAIVADAKANLDQAVTDGKLTAAQAAQRLADLKAHLDEIVNRSGPPAGHPGPGGPMFGAAAAAYLGLTEAELRTELRSGTSLAQVATAHGKTVAGLKAAILADAKQHLDADVAAGKLTAAQATAMLDRLAEHLDELVDRTGPPPRP